MIMHEEIHQTPNDGDWDVDAIDALNTEPPEDEIKAARANLMDKAITKSGALEKDGFRNDAKSGNNKESNLFVMPKHVLPVYVPGETVKGQIILELTEKMEAERFLIKFKGGARVSMRIYQAKGWYDDHGSELYVDEENVFWSRTDESAETNEDKALIVSGDSVQEHAKFLTPGVYRYQFYFHIPANAKGSVPPLINSSSDYAHILYRATGVIDKGNLWNRGNIVCTQAVWIKTEYDIAASPELFSEFTVEEEMNTGMFRSSGKVICKAKLQRKAFVRGETIPVSLLIENADNNEIVKVDGRIVLGGHVRTGTGTVKIGRSISLKSTKVTAGAVSGDSVIQASLELPLTFDDIDSNLLPAGSLDDCSLINIKYEVIIKLRRKGLHRHLELKIPIIVGTENSQPQLSEPDKQ